MLCFDLTSELACLRLEGTTRADYLQRLGSGDMNAINEIEGRSTCLLTPIGRIVDHVIVLNTGDALLLIGHTTHREKLHRWLRKFIFFNDEVRVQDSALRVAGVYGDGADAWAGPALQASQLYAHTLMAYGTRIVKTRPLNGAGYWIIGDAPTLPQPPLDLAQYHALRIEHGYPSAPTEISEDNIPLETGLWSAVSFRKGCYTGQEIIARMESRNQVPRKLYLLDVTGAKPGEAVMQGNSTLGAISSAAHSRALAFLRMGATPEDTPLLCGGARARIMRAVNV